METQKKLQILLQFLHEKGYATALEALENDSGVRYESNSVSKTGQLEAILDEHHERCRERIEVLGSTDDLCERGDGQFANRLHVSLGCLAPSSSILAVSVNCQGVLAVGTNKGALLVISLPDPLPTVPPVLSPTTKHLHKGGILGLAFHPDDENLLLTCGMDRMVSLLSVSSESIETLQTFSDHQKYVVRVQWSPSGKFFISSSYDKTVNIYKQDAGETQCCTQIQTLSFRGAVEGVCFFRTCEKFVVGVRDDHRLHVCDLSTSTAEKRQTMNMNAIGDDFVSFTPMDISTSPDDKYILVSTDKNRLILYRAKTGQQVANFYGAVNDEYSHPRHCWHPTGQYIYATSQNKAVHVCEVASQKVVACLEGHSGVVVSFGETIGFNNGCSFLFIAHVLLKWCWNDIEATRKIVCIEHSV